MCFPVSTLLLDLLHLIFLLAPSSLIMPSLLSAWREPATMRLCLVCSLCLKCSSIGDPQAQILGSSRLCSEFTQLVTTRINIYHPGHPVLPASFPWFPFFCTVFIAMECLLICFLFVSFSLYVNSGAQFFFSPILFAAVSSVFSEIEWMDGFVPCPPEGFFSVGRVRG